MSTNIPEHLKPEGRAVEAQIREAFRGVSREGGVSWSESVVIDDCGSCEQRAAACALDCKSTWEDLVDDPGWQHDRGVGGFNFLDPIGYRYYIAPAIIRCARLGYGEWIGYALGVEGEFKANLVSLLTKVQKGAIARFVRFMIATHAARNDEIYGEDWQMIHEKYWKQFDADPQQA